jgi:16S rRNA (cytosine1402-N4)-methyltransferase
MQKNEYHESVLVNEVIENLQITKGGKYIDCTLGNGGHTLEILKLGGKVLGIDLDPGMLSIAKSRIKTGLAKSDNYILAQGNFAEIDRIAAENGFTEVDGILFDLGVTNLHLKNLERGFSFDNPDAVLDMRINPELQGVRACDLLNVLREDQLQEMFGVVLDRGPARWLSHRVEEFKKEKPIETVGDILEICRGLKTGKDSLNEATLPFLALRIAVNGELDNLIEALPKSFKLLVSGGRLVVISFHSKEDEIVKDFFREKNLNGEADSITYKPILANSSELEINRRARSAKLRVIQKT